MGFFELVLAEDAALADVDPAATAVAEFAAVEVQRVGPGWFVPGLAGHGVAFVAAVFGFVGVVVVAPVVVFAQRDEGDRVGESAEVVSLTVMHLAVDGWPVAAGVSAEDLVAGEGGAKLWAGESLVF